MATLIDFRHVIADAFQKVHVEMSMSARIASLGWFAVLLSENDGFTRFLDSAFGHGFVNDGAEVEVASHLCLEIIVPSVDDVAAVRGVEGIVDRVRAIGHGIGNVTRAL